MNYIKRLRNWIMEGKYLYMFIFLIVFIVFLDKIDLGLELNTNDNVRIYGLFLQLLGTLIVVFSLKEKLFLFKGYGFGKLMRNYLNKFPLTSNKGKNTIEVKIETGTIKSKGYDIKPRILPKDDFKDIVRYLNEEIEHIHTVIVKEKKEIMAELSQLKSEQKNSDTEVNNKILETKQLISDSTVSNVWREVFGIFTILLGLILGTTPDLIVKLIW